MNLRLECLDGDRRALVDCQGLAPVERLLQPIADITRQCERSGQLGDQLAILDLDDRIVSRSRDPGLEPGAALLACIASGGVERALGDAEIEVPEYRCTRGMKIVALGEGGVSWPIGLPIRAPSGTATSSKVTVPLTVRRWPMLSQSSLGRKPGVSRGSAVR